MVSRTKQRLQEQVARKIALLLQQEVKDPRLSHATVTGVEVTPDGSQAKVYFCCYGSDQSVEAVSAVFKQAAGFLSQKLAKTLSMRRTPQLQFVYDKSLDDAQTMDTLLSNPSS